MVALFDYREVARKTDNSPVALQEVQSPGCRMLADNLNVRLLHDKGRCQGNPHVI